MRHLDGREICKWIIFSYFPLHDLSRLNRSVPLLFPLRLATVKQLAQLLNLVDDLLLRRRKHIERYTLEVVVNTLLAYLLVGHAILLKLSIHVLEGL